jgi:hypothetical protein
MQHGLMRAAPGALDLSLDNARLAAELAEVQRRFDAATAEHHRVCEQLVAVNQQSGDLLELHVSICRLYESADRASALDGIREIVISVLGSEAFAVLTLDRDRSALSLIASMGVDAEPLERIEVGDGVIGQVALTGRGRLGDPGMVACVPLKVGERVAGVLAVFELLSHKPELEPLDLELLEALSAHAAAAMHVAERRENTQAPAVA